MHPRIAVVGCGQWGQNHVRTLAEIGALAAVADRSFERADLFAERHGVKAMDTDEAIASPDIDALVLALPASMHGPTARAAFAAGKDVLIEKPIALDIADAELTAAVAKKTERLLMVGHVLRFHPVFQKLCTTVAEGRIGTVRHIIANRMGLGRFLGMDVVWDLAPHDLSMILKLANAMPRQIEATRRTVLSDATDIADISLEFPGGLQAEVHVSRVSPYRDRRFSVIGTTGMLVFDDLAPEGEKLALYGHKVWRDGPNFSFENAPVTYLPVCPGLPLDRELRHFIDCVAHRRPPETGAAEAVETVRILNAASPLGPAVA
ncbi:Gfo/Idh/MocA family oxidoreductase [Jiella sp. MQZ9-1]|uniref:Gfo/Idh/MocA family oxidoreductase n=1 Tax=Jiella flava TaxID=2816857 RepID=A0A939JW24_9HYPH|nr:Gfo/Idh/MocA family oxidoreductase [Jiella flava]MBO0663064.1 Gfo/Idh/MocA family oxidoreductase [Jiella flava]MCD2471483.1 Gfo/Idh/MocA family oxidoreductase [Jiella flava]